MEEHISRLQRLKQFPHVFRYLVVHVRSDVMLNRLIGLSRQASSYVASRGQA
jgi:hypothetical protein